MPELSVIIPYVQEWPQVIFTVASIAEELRDEVDFEIIVVDNYVPAPGRVNGEQDRAREYFDAVAKGQKWLKSLEYKKKLSHWQAKNWAVENAEGDFLWFCDAHCVISKGALVKMFRYYRDHHEELNGTLHLPLTYSILEWHKLIYKLVDDSEKGVLHYSFTGYRDAQEAYPVPCMSTCGMMMTRELYGLLGGWPQELGIYGGGEHFINFCLAILGKTINIFPGDPLRHHGDKRGYSWFYDDYHRNRMVATYCFGGEDWLRLYTQNTKGNQDHLRKIEANVIETCRHHRHFLEANQVISIDEWRKKCAAKNS